MTLPDDPAKFLAHKVYNGKAPTDLLAETPADYRENVYQSFRAALASLGEGGWVMVPVEPTDEMIDAAKVAIKGDASALCRGTSQSIECFYRAMLRGASPTDTGAK